jgi:hypothetical protein
MQLTFPLGPSAHVNKMRTRGAKVKRIDRVGIAIHTPALVPSIRSNVSGTACVLERLPEAFARFMSHRALSRDFRTREDKLQSAQQRNRQPSALPQGRCGNGDDVEQSNIIKGYEVAKGEYIELNPEELEAVALESKRTIDIEEFVPKSQIDELYLRDPYYIAPDGDVGQQAFAVLREAIRKEGMVALGKVVFTSREHIIALEARDKGMMGITVRRQRS